jgi:hypothetical protein
MAHQLDVDVGAGHRRDRDGVTTGGDTRGARASTAAWYLIEVSG